MVNLKRSVWIFGAGLAGLIVAALLVSRGQTQHVPEAQAPQETQVVSEEKLPSSTQQTVKNQPAKVSHENASPESKPIQVAQPPSLKTLRDDVAKNPHETPQALLRFGADLGVRMEEAKKDKNSAIQLLSELKGCSQPASVDDSPVQARAICLVTAREIAQIWPDLKNSVEEVVSGADSKARELANKIPGFSR